MYIPTSFYRRKALAALKGHWQTALLVALVVNLPTLMMQAFSAFTGNDLLSRMESVIVAASRDGVLTRQLLLNEINAFLGSASFWTIRGLELLSWLITPCLSLGMLRWLTGRLRGQEYSVSVVFSRMRLFFKAIGLQLLIILKVLLWMLPGIAATVAVMLPVFRAGGTEAQMAALQSGNSMMLPVTLLTAVPAVMAALRYALSEYVMADRPESRILGCIRRSKELMKDQKKNLFFLLVSFLLWYLLELVISSFLTGVLSILFQMLAGLALIVYLYASIAAFWLRLEEADAKQESPDAEPAPEELN